MPTHRLAQRAGVTPGTHSRQPSRPWPTIEQLLNVIA
jgi:hypothetical protein